MRTGTVRAIMLAAALAACAIPAATNIGPPPPREILAGRMSFVREAISADIAEQEIADTLRPMLAQAPVCMRMPGLWLAQPPRGSDFLVRFDLMQRDWGLDVADAARARLDAFVAMGFLNARPVDGAMAYVYTMLGRSFLRGTFASGRPPAFCAPTERQFLAITSRDAGEFSCGSLRVRFSHGAQAWPSWANTDAAQAYLTEHGLAPGQVGEGAITLSRLWYTTADLPRGRVNGALGSLCYDARRDDFRGNDLTLFAGGAFHEEAPEDVIVEPPAGDIEAAPLPDLAPQPEGEAEIEGPTP